MSVTVILDGIPVVTGLIYSKGYNANITAVSATPYAVLQTDEVIAVTTGGNPITLNLPAATATGRKLLIIQVDGGGGSVVITPNGADTIEGNATVTISAQNGKCGLVDAITGVWSDLSKGAV